MPANKAFSLTPPLRPEPRWQGMAISLAFYALLFVAGMILHREPAATPQDTRTPEEIEAAREQLRKRQVRMVYIPPEPRQRAQPRAVTPPPKLPPPKPAGPTGKPDPQSDPIRAIRSPVADPGGDASKLGEGAQPEEPKISPPRPVPLALNPGPAVPTPPIEPAPTTVASAGMAGGIQLGPRLGLAPRDPRPWTQSMPERGDSCPTVMPDSTKPGEPRMGSASGRVLSLQGGGPMPNAHLQIIGTAFSTFTDSNGEYVLTFDASLLDACRTQYVRVSAPGYEPRLLVLVIGRNIRSDDVALRRN
jgi:hypothetical protein